jgi:hypothetical protein
MASPSSGDDYYASLGNEPAHTGGGSEKKKIIKIVAKKASAPIETPVSVTEAPAPIDTTPISNISNVSQHKPESETLEEDKAYISRTVKLPESGALDLGTKF